MEASQHDASETMVDPVDPVNPASEQAPGIKLGKQSAQSFNITILL